MSCIQTEEERAVQARAAPASGCGRAVGRRGAARGVSVHTGWGGAHGAAGRTRAGRGGRTGGLPGGGCRAGGIA